jgi:hypothetical protein
MGTRKHSARAISRKVRCLRRYCEPCSTRSRAPTHAHITNSWRAGHAALHHGFQDRLGTLPSVMRRVLRSAGLCAWAGLVTRPKPAPTRAPSVQLPSRPILLAQRGGTRVPPRAPSSRASASGFDGRYWARTSDPKLPARGNQGSPAGPLLPGQRIRLRWAVLGSNQ